MVPCTSNTGASSNRTLKPAAVNGAATGSIAPECPAQPCITRTAPFAALPSGTRKRPASHLSPTPRTRTRVPGAVGCCGASGRGTRQIHRNSKGIALCSVSTATESVNEILHGLLIAHCLTCARSGVHRRDHRYCVRISSFLHIPPSDYEMEMVDEDAPEPGAPLSIEVSRWACGVGAGCGWSCSWAVS